MLLETILTYYLIFTKPVPNTETVDLRRHFPVVFDQGRANSCTSNAITAVAKFHETVTNKNARLISRMDLYHQARKTPSVDRGATFQNSMNVIRNNGICDEALWPYSYYNINTPPPQRCVERRKLHSSMKPFRLPSNSRCIAYAIRTQHPVVVGVLLTKTFQNSDERVPTLTEPVVSKHAMVAVGVTENDDCFVIRNSWGQNWKNHGYITVPRLFIDRFVVDSWILVPLDGVSELR